MQDDIYNTWRGDPEFRDAWRRYMLANLSSRAAYAEYVARLLRVHRLELRRRELDDDSF